LHYCNTFLQKEYYITYERTKKFLKEGEILCQKTEVVDADVVLVEITAFGL
jgi:hypothetical protein